MSNLFTLYSICLFADTYSSNRPSQQILVKVNNIIGVKVKVNIKVIDVVLVS